MDLWSINLKSVGGGGGIVARESNWGLRRRRVMAGQQSPCWRNFGAVDEDCALWGGMLRVASPAFSRRRWEPVRRRSWGVTAKGKKSGRENSHGGGDPSIPEEGPKDRVSPDDTLVQNSRNLNLDWRTFRASLVAQEKGQGRDQNASRKEMISQKPSSNKLGSKWAHPIPVPETGCILIATDKLDGVRTFERTVILLLRIGTKDPRDGPFGVILNRPLHKKIKHMRPTNPELATTFADCPLHFGGPLDASMFLLKGSSSTNFEEVVPGICFGARNSLEEASGLVKGGEFQPKDFQFFVGYAGWQADQLRDEIESGYWIVAACSSDLIGCDTVDSALGLWEETLMLMGGRYSDLSRKAKESDD